MYIRYKYSLIPFEMGGLWLIFAGIYKLVAISEKTVNMKQSNFSHNILELNVRKSPIVIRSIFFFFAFAFFIFPLLGAITSLSSGKSFHISYLISIGIFSLMGFYMLRISLWNTFGKETLIFLADKIVYEADYGWFKDAKKELSRENAKYSFLPIGYEEDNNGVLLIENNDDKIQCAVKIHKENLEKIIVEIETATNRL